MRFVTVVGLNLPGAERLRSGRAREIGGVARDLAGGRRSLKSRSRSSSDCFAIRRSRQRVPATWRNAPDGMMSLPSALLVASGGRRSGRRRPPQGLPRMPALPRIVSEGRASCHPGIP